MPDTNQTPWMWALSGFFLIAIAGAILLSAGLSGWPFGVLFLVGWIGSGAKLRGSLLVKAGGGFVIAIAGTLAAAFVATVFLGAALA